jgi:glyoxylase-like metal-dependent hydrolase (beta-lactamase superfamily II)
VATFRVPHNSRVVAGDTLVVSGLTNSGFVDGAVVDTCDDEAPYAGVAISDVVITHGHADHFAVAATIRDDGAKSWAPRDDASLVENPDINIRGMFSWAKPGDIFITKLFRGTPCKVDALVEEWVDPRLTPVPLPGHTLGHTGFLSPDKVLFSGDALYQKEIWERHRLPYAIDPGDVASSLERIRTLDFDWLVPGHGRVIDREEADTHIDFHLAEIDRINAFILDALKTERTTEDAIAVVSAERGLSDNPAQYWLAVTTVKGFLGDMLARGELEFFVRDHAGWWKTADTA